MNIQKLEQIKKSLETVDEFYGPFLISKSNMIEILEAILAEPEENIKEKGRR